MMPMGGGRILEILHQFADQGAEVQRLDFTGQIAGLQVGQGDQVLHQNQHAVDAHAAAVQHLLLHRAERLGGDGVEHADHRPERSPEVVQGDAEEVPPQRRQVLGLLARFLQGLALHLEDAGDAGQQPGGDGDQEGIRQDHRQHGAPGQAADGQDQAFRAWRRQPPGRIDQAEQGQEDDGQGAVQHRPGRRQEDAGDDDVQQEEADERRGQPAQQPEHHAQGQIVEHDTGMEDEGAVPGIAGQDPADGPAQGQIVEGDDRGRGEQGRPRQPGEVQQAAQ